MRRRVGSGVSNGGVLQIAFGLALWRGHESRLPLPQPVSDYQTNRRLAARKPERQIHVGPQGQSGLVDQADSDLSQGVVIVDLEQDGTGVVLGLVVLVPIGQAEGKAGNKSI